MFVSKLDHIGIAVHSLEAALPFYREILGMPFEGVEEVAEQKVKVAFLGVGKVGSSCWSPPLPNRRWRNSSKRTAKGFTISPIEWKTSRKP